MENRKPNRMKHQADPKEEPNDIGFFIIMGDSLSDRGGFKAAHGVMFQLMGAAFASRFGRFTSGRSWADHFSANIIINLVTERLKKKGFSEEDIVNGIIDKDPKISAYIQKSFNLQDHKQVSLFSQDLIRTYCEGGLTSDNYANEYALDPKISGARAVISNLEAKLELLLKDDERKSVTKEQKAETLVVEWSGANDLATVNKNPDFDLVRRTIQARILNIKTLIKNGYQNFVLFNLPDLALTPRYHNLSDEEKENVHIISTFFNKKLKESCEYLQKKHPECIIQVFDVNSVFSKVYNDPEQYGFDRSLRNEPYKSSQTDSRAQSGKYLFWDDVHPTDQLHKLLADEFFEKFTDYFHLKENKGIDSSFMKKTKLAEEQKMQQGDFQKVDGYKFEAIKKNLQELPFFQKLLNHHKLKTENDSKFAIRKKFLNSIKTCKNLDELAMLISPNYRKSCFAHSDKLTTSQLRFLQVADNLYKSLCEQTTLFKSGTAHYLTYIEIQFTHFIEKMLTDKKVFNHLFRDSPNRIIKRAA
jgi:hypothetical protein